ncbi:asparaginase [Rubrobacter aplysinae]|uniref:asparaginase n=1 Tax=Rubrobacter aplysinae TaxID=909625 RepID=UPI00069E3AFB|nr:asparaginase [Rubrobacter aplysinae]
MREAPTAPDPPDVPLAALYRAGLAESVHRGRYAVCDAGGGLLDSGGETGEPVWVRSSAKPFQALPLVVSGAAGALGLTDEELVVACGSHGGEEAHVATVRSILGKAGLSEEALQSGAHPPLNGAASRALARAGGSPRPVHGNCSGKHAGMLALCSYRGWETASYLDRDHPVQREILGAVSRMCGLDEREVLIGGDGCGAPAFALPLRSLAAGFARLASCAAPEPFGAAADRVRRAMGGHPFMVAGTGRLDTRLMQGAEFVCKSGAEGIFTAGLPDGTGLAIKVSDGSGRALEPAALSLLGRLGAEPLPEPDTVVRDLHGAEVGSLGTLV